MGSWSKAQREGGRFGGIRKGTKLGPRRKIVEVLYIPDNIISPARVKYECGHEGRTFAGRSCPVVGMLGHCRKCITEPVAVDAQPATMPTTMAPSSKALIAWSDEIRDAILAHCESLGVGYAEFTRELWCREIGRPDLLEQMRKRGRQPKPKKAPAKKKPKK